MKSKPTPVLNRDDAEDVTNQFYWLSMIGMCILLVQALVYYIQTREEMFIVTMPWTILVNIISLIWFICLQYFRFKDSGRACSGDFTMKGGFANPFLHKVDPHQDIGERVWPKEKTIQGEYLLVDQGFWFLVYVIMQYVLYIISKVTAIIMTNRLEAEYEEEKAKLGGIHMYQS